MKKLLFFLIKWIIIAFVVLICVGLLKQYVISSDEENEAIQIAWTIENENI